MKKQQKINVIIDTDPGVDDAVAIALSLYDELMDIKLITTVSGNLDLKTVTRNTLHILEKFERTDIPVVMGASKPMKREAKDAKFIHQNDGLGGYIPPKTVKTKPMDQDAVEAMYKTIKKYKNNIVIIELGPQTNLGHLLTKHPDVVNMINHIYSEGCSPYGWKSEGRWVNYISFNASSDPEALKIVVDSGIPMTMVPSRMGRELANFTEKDVLKIREINDVGRFIAEMYNGYWEHNYADRRIATNDTCACLVMRFPKLFKTKKANFSVDINEQPGKTTVEYSHLGNVDFVYNVNKRKMHKYFFNAIKKLNNFKFYK